ncbi:MAG: hypothetical protein DMF70_09945, partial [Acidobacteria bacterium]
SRFAETIGGDWFDHDCRPKTAVDFALLRPCMQRLLGATIPVSIVLFLFLVERFDRKQDQRIALLLWIDLFKHCRRPSAARHVQPERGIGFVDVARNGGVVTFAKENRSEEVLRFLAPSRCRHSAAFNTIYFRSRSISFLPVIAAR